ncbi:MAG: 3-hydroxyacyl-ACP dehydratase FabZ family protein [Polyangia bacterium]
MSGLRDLPDLPHRAPFRLVDRLASRTEQSATAIRQVTANDPLMGSELPATLVVEALAQTAALMNDGTIGAHRGFLVALRDVRFESSVHAGDTLSLHTERTASLGGLHRVMGRAHVGDRLVASGEMTFAIEVV